MYNNQKHDEKNENFYESIYEKTFNKYVLIPLEKIEYQPTTTNNDLLYCTMKIYML